MAGKVVANRPSTSFDFEIVDNDYDQLTTISASANHINPWINPASIKLRHRLGRGPFGDVWLATRHQVTEDYEEYHEVAVKMLHHIKEDNIKAVLDKLNVLLSETQGLQGACLLHGVSVISGKICIVMKFYEGSVGDQMARFKGGKLSLPDVLRYGIDLAQGIMEVHSKESLILNLKPFNILLNGDDKAILGDLGIPYVLLGVPLPSSDMTRRLGTPNYMAPEQWQPEVRGPLAFETDSWGFGCSIVEMLTGVQPWCGKSIDEIYNSVVKRQEKPHIPDGLPPAVVNVIIGCFEYDFRSRPLMADILHVFERTIVEKSNWNGYTEWFLSKDRLQVGDMVRSRKPLNSCKPENMVVPAGIIVGLDTDSNQNGFVLVRVHGIHDPVRVHGSTLERVTFGLAAGDWVRLKKENNKHSPIGILHSINRDGSVAIGIIGIETLWKGVYSDLQMAESYCTGQFVRLKSNVISPRFQWLRKRGYEWATGRVSQVLPNGCLVVKFPNRLAFGDENSCFLADPAEVELISFSTSPNMMKKYQHLEDFHWVVRPFLVSLGLFTAIKLGFCVGKKMGRATAKNSEILENQQRVNITNAKWLPPNMANIIFREGVTTTPR
ncbi:E3 ubiquitin-protein ligase KEG isoform X2 [Cynara cardunculus var. scolymus]|uniref:E3 ubiquitin-protein ligase KEG isoform X2 n=1 Tax=Cynara cardunculus var. scolymus TaxID=59895 RepID=UPI000D622F8E|nr:E3 ubiquitin-protein ligase KEG isoform X2 [Cynara cardunculus var. scolymus]